jgi:hypothetical protein
VDVGIVFICNFMYLFAGLCIGLYRFLSLALAAWAIMCVYLPHYPWVYGDI